MSRMTTPGRVVLSLVLIFLFGVTAPSARAEPSAVKDGCELRLTGAIDGTTQGGGGSGSVITEHWMTDEEVRRMIAFAMLGSKPLTDEEKTKKVATQMHEDPPAMLLLVSCETHDVTLTLGTSKGSTQKHIRMKPRRYVIAPEGASKPGQIVAIVHIKSGTPIFGVEGGTLSITEWDKRHIAATFEIAGRSKFEAVPRTVSLKGRFDFSCRGGDACQKR